jgi:hypothetical protein
VDVAATDAARPHAHEHVLIADLGRGHVDDGEFLVVRK